METYEEHTIVLPLRDVAERIVDDVVGWTAMRRISFLDLYRVGQAVVVDVEVADRGYVSMTAAATGLRDLETTDDFVVLTFGTAEQAERFKGRWS